MESDIEASLEVEAARRSEAHVAHAQKWRDTGGQIVKNDSDQRLCPAEGVSGRKPLPAAFSFRTEFPMPLQLRQLRCRCGAGAYAIL
jgi:hypothetical protein